MQALPMHGLTALLALLLLSAAAHSQDNTTTGEKGADLEPGFVSVFNGTDLTDWEGNKDAWSVRDGTIRSSGGQTRNNWLIWRGGDLTDFELRLSFKLTRGNSGVQVRSKKIDSWRVRGYQVEVAAREQMGLWHHSQAPEPYRSTLASAGQRVHIAPNGRTQVEQRAEAADVQAAYREGEWNELEVIATGAKLVQKINGVVFAELVDEDAQHAVRSGFLALQDHGAGTVVAFKDIRVKHLEASAASMTSGQAAHRPNILWITAEDMSPTLGCYGDTFAMTPHIDQLATEGVLYSNAFATAPVCSPSRSCLINGLYAPSQGTHNMRSAFPIPKQMTGFPSFLRTAGYFTSNNVKTDYNSGNYKEIIQASWDDSSDTAHWRNREKRQPFFCIFNLMTSHQSRTMVWPYEQFISEVQSELAESEIHDPAKVALPPYYPDTPVIRKTVARFYDCVTAMDKQVGAILKQLEDDGLADDTIVFFYADHGSGMPRHKRLLLDSGMKVPLIVKFPKKYRDLAPGKPGTRTDRLVSFVDFGPTVLSLAGVDVPDYMQGRPFLGSQEDQPRDFVHGHRDRVDEVHDFARSVRDTRYLYIRNFMPHLGYNQPTAWPDLGEIRHEFYRLADPEKMTAPQWHFAGPTRQLEELYDCQADPMNLQDLAGSEEHREVLDKMRAALFRHIHKSQDLGFLPEALAWDISEGTTLWEIARSHGPYNQQRLVRAASEVGRAEEEDFLANLKHTDAGVRYWGAVGLNAAHSLSSHAVRALTAALSDPAADVRIESADALARHGHTEDSIPVLAAALSDGNLAAVQHAARKIQLLGDRAKSAVPAMKACDGRMKLIRPPGTSPLVVEPDKDKAMFVLFSTEAFLRRFGGTEDE